MKFMVRITFAILLLLSFASSQSVYTLVMALSGGNENPAVPTSGYAYGWATLDLNQNKLTYALAYDSLSGPPTGSHFHFGAAGVSGPVVKPITIDTTTGTVIGEWTNIPDTMLAHILKGNVYCNIHTTAHGGGEIRGQLEYTGPFTFGFTASGANENPANAEIGKAIGFASLASGQLTVAGVFKKLTGAPSGMHIHYGAAGQNGGVAIALANVGSKIVGSGLMPKDSAYRRLLSGEMYYNIHTTAHSGGELRGQLVGPRFFPFWASMSGTLSVPPNASEGLGIFLLRYDGLNKLLEYESQLIRISNVSAAHIHSGAIGLSGGVMVPLTAYSSVGHTRTEETGIQVVDSVLRHLTKTESYVNVHTSAFPGGEIRGQILPAYDPVTIAFPDSAQSSPTTSSVGRGLAYFSFSGQDMNYGLVFNGLSGPATAAHIHSGVSGKNGGVIIPLDTNTVDGVVSNVADTTMIRLLRGGNHYVNIHTSMYPGGEIRGDIFPFDGTDQGTTGVTPETVNGKIPESYTLEQNFPNPFNPTTNIQFSLPQGSYVSLKIFDMLGREIRTLFNGNVNAGVTNIEWNGQNNLGQHVASGMYLYRIETGSFTATKKMVLLK